MISHDKAQALISARYDELLSPAETRAVQEHLASCAACRQFAAETDLLVSGLRTLPQLPPSPRVSRAVQDGIRGGVSPWGWLGRGMRIATSPALAVASSLVLVAALAFIIVLALRPLGLDEQPRATISALADVIETPTTEPERTPITAPTVAPTEPAVFAPTQEPTARLTNVAPPTQTPVSTAVVEPTAVPTQRSIVTPETPTAAPVVETPEPTVAPPAVPAPTQVPEQSTTVEAAPTSVVEIANQAVTVEPTSPPILPAAEGAPFTGEEPVEVDEGSEAPPAYEQPAIVDGGPNEGAAQDPVADVTVDQGAGDVTIAGEPSAETAVPATDDAATQQAADAAAEPTAPPAAPTSTPVQIMAAESAPPPASSEAPQLEPRTGNEAVSLDGDSMVAEIQATVQAGLTDDSGPPTFPPEPTPLPTTPAQADLTAMTPTVAPGDAAIIQPGGAEITGAPGSGTAPLMTEDVPPVADVAVSEGAEVAPEVAPIEAATEQVPVAPQVVGAPEPQWPGIGGGGTQFMSNSGYSAIADGGGVTVYGPDGAPLGWVGSGVPIWSPGGTSLLVIGPDGLGAVWDVNAGPIPVERPETGARDIPVGWYDGSPLVQRVYFDGSGRVELRVVPISGAAGYAVGTATADGVFGEGVTAAKLSPDGGQISFVSGGQLYIAPVSDPGSATPAG